LRGYINKWAEFEARRLEIEAECPMNAWPDCPSDEISTCWDGTDRETDCSCLANPYGACPATPCKDGAKRDLETCACPDDEASDI